MVTWRVIPTDPVDALSRESLITAATEQGWGHQQLPGDLLALTQDFDTHAAATAAVANLPIGDATIVNLFAGTQPHEQLKLVGSSEAATEISGLNTAAGQLLVTGRPDSKDAATGPTTAGTASGITADPVKKEEPAASSAVGNPPDAPPAPAVFEPAKLQTKFWEALDKTKQVTFAERYFQQAFASRTQESDITAWTLAPEMWLLNDIKDPAARDALRSEIVRFKLKTHSTEAAFDAVALQAAHKRIELVDVSIATSNELLAQMKRWRTLSQIVPVLLAGSIIIAVLFLLYAFNLVDNGKLTGAGLALIIFVLALFAISPAVLLLLERPLKGLDSFSPGSAAARDPSPPAPAATAAATTPKA